MCFVGPQVQSLFFYFFSIAHIYEKKILTFLKYSRPSFFLQEYEMFSDISSFASDFKNVIWQKSFQQSTSTCVTLVESQNIFSLVGGFHSRFSSLRGEFKSYICYTFERYHKDDFVVKGKKQCHEYKVNIDYPREVKKYFNYKISFSGYFI